MNSSSAGARWCLLAGSALAIAALTAGCAKNTTVTVTAPPSTSPASAPGSSAPATGSGPSGTAPATTAPASTGSGSGPSAQAGPPACASAALHASLGASQGAAGSFYVEIDFTNLGSSPCTLFGYPGVALAGGSPVTQIGAPAERDPTVGPQQVTLAPHEVAGALLRIVDAGAFPASACDQTPSTYLQVYPPNQTTPLFVPYQGMACKKTSQVILTIRAVRPGAGTAN